MDIDTAIFGRRSTREYTTEAVDESVILRLINAAVQAPSAFNEQPWIFTVLRDQALLDRISREAKAYMLATIQAGQFLPLLQDDNFQIFYHAPALVLISAKTTAQWVVEDCSLAAENLMLSAYAEGLGSCWIGFAQGFLNTADGKSALGLHAECTPVAPIIIGHPKSVPPLVARKTPEVQWIV